MFDLDLSGSEELDSIIFNPSGPAAIPVLEVPIGSLEFFSQASGRPATERKNRRLSVRWLAS